MLYIKKDKGKFLFSQKENLWCFGTPKNTWHR